MGLLKKALIYRNNFLNKVEFTGEKSLLKRALSFLDTPQEENNLNLIDHKTIIDNILNDDNYDLSEHYNDIFFSDSDLGDEKIQLIDDNEDSENKLSSYFNIINNIADSLSSISLNNNPGKEFIRILNNNFKFQKDIFLIYSIDKENFIYWNGSNISKESQDKICFDLNYKDIYKQIVSKKYLLLKKEDNIEIFNELLGDEEKNNSDFILFIPFTFSGHIIGLYTILKLNNNSIPDNELIEGLLLVGRLNGSLLYNIYQQEKLKILSDEFNEDKTEEINETVQSDKVVLNDPLNNFKTFIKNLISKKIEKFSIIHLEFKNNNENSDFDLLNFYSDIQFIVMNIVGTNSYVEILEDMEILVILPQINKEYADKVADKIIEEINNIFIEITLDYKPVLNKKIVNYPEDSTNITEIISFF